MRSTISPGVTADLTTIRRAVDTKTEEWRSFRPKTFRSLLHILLDWVIIGLTYVAILRVGLWTVPIGMILIGNRQRALANLLHEAGHNNLSLCHTLNDFLGSVLLAAPLFCSLSQYRQRHARHHAYLGNRTLDPDLIPVAHDKGKTWARTYIRVLTTRSIWLDSIFGQLLTIRQHPAIALSTSIWWGVCLAPLLFLTSSQWVIECFAIWMTARATTFHAITIFREMTDHFGLVPGGVFSYTRDIPDHGVLSLLLHPHHNGYHLTHHLFPHIPYSDLPSAHVRLMRFEIFRRNANMCCGYFKGSHASVNGWGIRHA